MKPHYITDFIDDSAKKNPNPEIPQITQCRCGKLAKRHYQILRHNAAGSRELCLMGIICEECFNKLMDLHLNVNTPSQMISVEEVMERVAIKDRIKELEEKLIYSDKLSDQFLEERNQLLNTMPLCPAHGKCMPFAMEWIAQVRTLAGIIAGATKGIGMDDYVVNIAAIKTDLEAAVERLISEKRTHDRSLQRMLECEGIIEHSRNTLNNLGVITKREKPFGKVEYV